MPRTQGPNVIDRSSDRPLETKVHSGTGLEAVTCLLILNSTPPYDHFERGAEIARAVRRGLPESVERALTRFRTPDGDAWLGLLGLIASNAPPHDLETVVESIKRMSPADVKAAMTAAGGDSIPIRRIQERDVAELVVEALRDLPADLYAPTGAADLLARNQQDAQRLLADDEGVESVIERLTRGLIYKAELGISGLVLVPSWVHRPWTLVLDHGPHKVFIYPARLETELAATDMALIGIYRALGDATRLKILRRLAAGTASVGRISEELGLAKSTVHEHLLNLRTAGLVKLPSSGGFALEAELPDLNWMLKEFLGLEMRRRCEVCETALEPDGEAFICSYECTFCRACAEGHAMTCPNCAGELVERPRRSKIPVARRRGARPHRDEVLRRRG